MILDQKLDFVTKGLSLKLKGSYNSSYGTTKVASSSKAKYTPVITEMALRIVKKALILKPAIVKADTVRHATGIWNWL